MKVQRRDAGADTTALKQKIDRLVYALYRLILAEIKLVDESAATD